jgi:hypothetical protein
LQLYGGGKYAPTLIMKKIIVLFYFLLLGSKSFSQNFIISFKDEFGKAIPYVTLVNKEHQYTIATNENGLVILKTGNYSFTTSHISFNDSTISLKKSVSDSLISYTLNYKSVLLKDVIIPSTKLSNKKKIYSYGNQNKKTVYKDQIFFNLKMGMWVTPQINFSTPNYLRSIKFRITNHKELIKQNFTIELKLYEIINNKIEDVSLNKKPIYLKSSKIKKRNEVFIDEIIKIPENGFFISIELPQEIDAKNNFVIEFVTDYTSNTCRLFVNKNNQIVWPKNLLLSSCPTSEFNGMHKELMLGFSYYK